MFDGFAWGQPCGDELILYDVFDNPGVMVSARSCVICIKGLGPGGCQQFQIRYIEVLVVMGYALVIQREEDVLLY
jgi:hypothetical protein